MKVTQSEQQEEPTENEVCNTFTVDDSYDAAIFEEHSDGELDVIADYNHRKRASMSSIIALKAFHAHNPKVSTYFFSS